MRQGQGSPGHYRHVRPGSACAIAATVVGYRLPIGTWERNRSQVHVATGSIFNRERSLLAMCISHLCRVLRFLFAGLLGSAGWGAGVIQAHHPKDVTYHIFQFPRDRLPTIDGDPADWEMVPAKYTIDGSHLMDTVMGKGQNLDPKDLAVEVKVGWSPHTNRLYFLYKVYDDMHNFNLARGDIFEVVVDADHSGGRYHTFDDVDAQTEARLKSTTAQNYHIFTPPAEGKAWAWVWGEQQWLIEKPWSEHAFRYDFGYKEAGELYLEFSITPFNYASFRGPKYSALHQLEAGQTIGLSWSVLDYDEHDDRYEGFWNLSHHTRMDYTASLLPNFKLLPLAARQPAADRPAARPRGRRLLRGALRRTRRAARSPRRLHRGPPQ